MKIIVKIDDFWYNEDRELTSELEKYVSNKVFEKIWKSIEKKVDKVISDEIEKDVKKQMTDKVNKLMDKAFETDDVIVSRVYENGKYVNVKTSLAQYVTNKLEKESGWGSPNAKIEAIAKTVADDMKKRYDLLFASQVVSKLSENGFLKEDVKKMLEDSNSK